MDENVLSDTEGANEEVGDVENEQDGPRAPNLVENLRRRDDTDSSSSTDDIGLVAVVDPSDQQVRYRFRGVPVVVIDEREVIEGESDSDRSERREMTMEEYAAYEADNNQERLGSTMEDDTGNEDEIEQFDVSLAAQHTYMGEGLIPLSGRAVLEAGWEGTVPVMARHGTVFPGETIPMLLTNSHDVSMIAEAIKKDKLFGIICPDEHGSSASGYGVLCEVYEVSAAFAALAAAGAGGGAAEGRSADSPHSCKARAVHRFRFVDMPRQRVPISDCVFMRYENVRVLPEVVQPEPLRRARLASLDPLRRGRTPLDRQLRRMDAATTAWPLFVYDIFDYRRMRAQLRQHFKALMLDKLPSEPVSLSFWVASNLTLSPRERLALFVADDALLRLHMALRFLPSAHPPAHPPAHHPAQPPAQPGHAGAAAGEDAASPPPPEADQLQWRRAALRCAACGGEVARLRDVIAMSSDGVHSNYTNIGGFMHDIVTVSRAYNVRPSGGPSAEFSWYPGYTWTITNCAECSSHIGWRFDATKRTLRPRQFFAICRNYVTPREEARPSPSPSPPLLAPLALRTPRAPRAPR